MKKLALEPVFSFASAFVRSSSTMHTVVLTVGLFLDKDETFSDVSF